MKRKLIFYQAQIRLLKTKNNLLERKVRYLEAKVKDKNNCSLNYGGLVRQKVEQHADRKKVENKNGNKEKGN